MGIDKLSAALRQDLETAAARTGCELLEVNFGGGVLRVVLDREEGVTLQDCASVSRELSALLDVEDFGAGRYTLEVSSPGLDRRLYGLKDYERFAGSLAKITWKTEAGKRTDLMRLEGVAGGEGESLIVGTGAETSEPMRIPFARIQDARLEPEL
jgi:ribosome maturation factor RimP